MRDLEEMRYQEWDKILNEIYGLLKDSLPSAEMEALTFTQGIGLFTVIIKQKKGLIN